MSPRVTYPNWLKASLVIIVAVFVGVNFLFPPQLKALHQVSSTVKDKDQHWLAGFTIEDGIWRIQADIDEIDPRFIERLIAIEDKRYWNHSGVDITAILRAGQSWRHAGKPVSGASTITMQLVRQVEPRPRILASKVIETFRAIQLELYLSKDEILELYLTHISYGGNIEGVYAASQIYFGKPPFQLTDSEIALLIALPQAPEARRPDLNPDTAKQGRDKILEKLSDGGHLSPIHADEAKTDSVIKQRRSVPDTAWLSALDIKQDNANVGSTLDISIQNQLEILMRDFVENLDHTVNASAIVVENSTMAVRAHIASADRDRSGGWINMSRRARSPGSTLKPLIYGLGMDEGVITSGTLISDAPTRFGTYQPENFNRRYHGDVTITEALQHSLNVPAVVVMDTIGGNRFETVLSQSGIKVKNPRHDATDSNLAIALGGVGMTLNDLSLLYAALANGGEVKPLRWREDDPFTRGKRVLSEDSVKTITQVLRQAPTPKGRVPSWLSNSAPSLAYKTGTSWGFRDAWAAGYTDEWTVIVWVGRPDGAPRRGETGRKAAAPLLFDIMARLPDSSKAHILKADDAAPFGLKRYHDYTDIQPQILFPPDKSELLATDFGHSSRGFTFKARTFDDQVSFYVNGIPLRLENGQSVWRPETPGFYRVVAVDSLGRETLSNITVTSFDQLENAKL